MKRTLLIFLVALSLRVGAQNTFTIQDVIARSQAQSVYAKYVETNREVSYWNYRTFRSNYNPQIRLSSSTNAGALYNNSYSPIRQPDGSIQYLQVNQLNPGINIGLEQPIGWTGGTISLNSTYSYFRDIKESYQQWNGQVFSVRLSQPIFAFNRLKWDKRIEPIKYEESKREYAEQMQGVASQAVDQFFEVLKAQVNLEIAQYNLANNDTIYKIENGRYNIGTTSQDKLLQVELQLLRSRQDVAQAKLDLQGSSLRLRSYIGLQSEEAFQLVMPQETPNVVVSEELALQHARETRSDYIAFERRKSEANAEVARARGSRYAVSLDGGFGLNSVGGEFNELYNEQARQQYVAFTFSIPVVDWGRRKATMGTADAQKRLTDFDVERQQITFDQEVVTQVRLFETLKLKIEITRKADQVAFERYNVAQNRYLIGKIDITNLSIALNEKDDARRSYVDALKSFWMEYFRLRQLTLYDYVEQKYLYNPMAEQ
ncbi:TolC family protein [Chryseolinea sp. T2]|uniref:TolC family protein n=1 Tax=Chryseolinea sp. T2 TaxID=3129255 RepID=UPI00307844DF